MAATKTIAVDPQALKTFASDMLKVVQSTADGSLHDAKLKLNSITTLTFAKDGMIPEGDALKSTIMKYASQAATYLGDFIDGMTTLCNDLTTFAGTFANADALAKANAQSMWNAIGPDLETYFPNVVTAQPQPTIPNL